jgi:hypothetical protein
MIQYKDRIGFITHEHKKGLDLFLLPTSMHPEAELVPLVDPSEVTLAALPNAMNELTGMDRAQIAADELSKALGGGHVVRMKPDETREEALARGRKEILLEKASKDPHYGEEECEPDTDEVGRTKEELDSVGD